MSDPATITDKDETLYVRVDESVELKYSKLVEFVTERAAAWAVDWQALREAFKFGRGRDFPIGYSDPDELLAGKGRVRFSRDATLAYLVLYPPKPKGGRLTRARLQDLLLGYGVVPELTDHGALEIALDQLELMEPLVIARGRPARDADPVEVVWDGSYPSDPDGFFEELKKRGSNSPGAMISRVYHNSQAGRKRLGSPGEPGISAVGNPIEPKTQPDRTSLGHGLKFDPDSSAILATRNGHLRLHDGDPLLAEVLPLMVTDEPAEVAERAGNGFFPGSVIIEGDLEGNVPLRVLGDMEVRGSLIRTPVEVAGSLFVRDGISHNNPNPTRVGGLVSASFFERATVEARDLHVRRYSLMSNVRALDRIVFDPDAEMVGGSATAGHRIAAFTLGSVNSIATKAVIDFRLYLGFKKLLEGWAEELAGQEAKEEEAELITRETVRLVRIAAPLSPPHFTTARITARRTFAGVTVQLGTVSREVRETTGRVEFNWERIGKSGRVAMARK